MSKPENMSEMEKLRCLAEALGARSLTADTLREMADEIDRPDPEPWSPTPGAWASILPGADRGGVPEGVDRVLVTHVHLGLDRADVSWEGIALANGGADAFVNASSLGPVRTRVWQDADEVPLHVVARQANGAIAPRSIRGDSLLPFVGPYTEVLP